VFASSYRYIEHYRYADVVTGRLYMDLCYDVKVHGTGWLTVDI